MGQWLSTSNCRIRYPFEYCAVYDPVKYPQNRRVVSSNGDTHPPQCPLTPTSLHNRLAETHRISGNLVANGEPVALFVPWKENIIAGWTKPSYIPTRNPPTGDTSTASYASSNSHSSADILQSAVHAAWECQFAYAEELIESAQHPRVQMWAAKTEIALVRSLLTGKRTDIESVLHGCSKVVEISGDSLADRTAVAEVTLWRGLVQGLLGHHFRAGWSIRSAFLQAKNLIKDERVVGLHRDRLQACIGLVSVGIPLLSVNYRLLRLLGFDTDKQRGYDTIKAISYGSSVRNIHCALVLALYHLHVASNLDIVHDVVMTNLKHTQSPLLHWVATMCAWRNSNINEALMLLHKGLDCCIGLEHEPAYLKYELGIFYFVKMQYEDTIRIFSHFHAMANDFVFPHRAMLPIILAACHWACDRISHGDGFALEAIRTARSTLEVNLSRVADQVRLKRDSAGKSLFAIEVCYLLRVFPQLPMEILQSFQDKLLKDTTIDGLKSPTSIYISMLVCILSFYNGELGSGLQVCCQLERTALKSDDKYYTAHSFYWCSRIWNELGNKDRAISCAQLAAKGRRYPFDISVKVASFLRYLRAKRH